MPRAAVPLLLAWASTLAGLAATPSPAHAYEPEPSVERLKEHIRFLASDELEGRNAGQPGSEKAAAYLAERFAALGLEPVGDDGTHHQGFEFAVRGAVGKRARTTNVVGLLRGADEALADEVVLIGGHYDHVGRVAHPDSGRIGKPDGEDDTWNGADDNASGTAAMLAVAAGMSGRGPRGARATTAPRHTLIFCAFAGEETGLVGSSHFLDASPVPLASIEAMINMDMVGRLRDDRLMVMGVGTAAEFAGLVERANQDGSRFTLRTSGDGYGPSDHSSFYKRQVPVLALFTGAHPDYHKPGDSADKINAAGLWRVARFASALVESLDARPRPAFQRAQADSSTMGRIAGGGGYGAYLGTIPDYMQTEGGVLLSGVRAASPADSAGLRTGDVIVKFDGVRVDNIYDYTYALRSRKPGQQVRITVKRDRQELELLATLGRRR
jgi:hypothetical protein